MMLSQFYLENGWRPPLEIIILAVLIYYAFRFVRGTRGWPVVIGFVVVLLALALVTTMLNLQVLRWILISVSVFIAVGAIVIFQPELRRMLGELGNMPLFASASEQRESIEVIIQTVERLADVRIGALIAIEQSIQLQEAVEAGIRWIARRRRKCSKPFSSPTTPFTMAASSSRATASCRRPVLFILAQTAQATVLSRSASSSTMKASLPPSSIVDFLRFCPALAATLFPAPTLPVNATPLIRGSSITLFT